MTIERMFNSVSMGYCKKDVKPLLTHWSYIFRVLTHRYVMIWLNQHNVMIWFNQSIPLLLQDVSHRQHTCLSLADPTSFGAFAQTVYPEHFFQWRSCRSLVLARYPYWWLWQQEKVDMILKHKTVTTSHIIVYFTHWCPQPESYTNATR